MCGFVGQFNFGSEKIESSNIELMLQQINHRGPDSKGFYFNENFKMGHCRLSIQDISTKGNQPMHSSDGRYIIAYNGEIYNFKSLRKQLQIKNYNFKSKTDTEVILKGYIEWKEEVIKKLNGMFAFVIWDNKKKELFCARDRYGIKPLYYFKNSKSFIFSSEIKGLLKNSNVSKKLNIKSIKQYLIFQNNFTNETFFENIKSFPPGYFYIINCKQQRKIKYWAWNFFDDTLTRESRFSEGLILNKIENAVNKNLISSVPINTYLSSGIDSSIIAYFAKKKVKNLKSFTIGFEKPKKFQFEDESKIARHISEYLKINNYLKKLNKNCINKCVKLLTYAVENPRVGQSYPNYYAAKIASKHSKVVLSGIGGDEIFGGYPWRYFISEKKIYFEEFIDKYFKNWQRILNFDELKTLTGLDCEEEIREIFKDKFIKKSSKKLDQSDFINYSLEFEANTFLSGLLSIEDKISMSFSLETRVPFLDNDLVDYIQKIPAKNLLMNINSEVNFDENTFGNKRELFFKNKDGKKILRNIFNGILPDFITKNKKLGFTGPDEAWFREANYKTMQDNLNKDEPVFELLDFKYANSLIEEHIGKKKNRRLMIWSFIQINQWLKIFM